MIFLRSNFQISKWWLLRMEWLYFPQVLVEIEGTMMIGIKEEVLEMMLLCEWEVNINRIKPGARVTVTGIAFPGVTLQGEVSSVASQAQSASEGGSSGLSM